MFREHKYRHRSKDKGGVRWNMNRIAETWMGRYKRRYYKYIAPVRRRFGDIQERLKIKKDLNCKNFQWYLDNVFPMLKDMK
jgi:polypeptide N-acetylgalactosaminyltransferase